ncbi:MAG TPA: hypothetical protein VFX59_13840, partial [Polyangiales bacterium]|nr:hypothetical protein [Polyangiales bacterium]
LIASFAARTPPALHPSIRPHSRTEDSIIDDHTRGVLQDYYDLYDFGLSLESDEVGIHLQSAIARVEAGSSEATARIREELARTCAFAALTTEIAIYVASDDQRVQLHKRYTRISARCGYKFWAAGTGYSHHEWTALEPYLKWLNSGASLYVEIWKEVLRTGWLAMDLSIEEARVLLSFIYRHQLASQQQISTPAFMMPLPKAKQTAIVDIGAGSIQIGNGPAMQVKMTSASGPISGSLPRPRGYAKSSLSSAVAKPHVVSFKIDLPFDVTAARERGAEISNLLGAAMDGLNLAAGLLAAHERLGERDIQAWLDLGQNSFLGIDATVALYAGVRAANGRPLSSAWLNLGKVLGGTANIIDGLRNLAAGYEMLVGDDSPIDLELAKGNDFRAWVLKGKGVAQFGAGAAGLVAGVGELSQLAVFASASATGFSAFATGPVGIAIAFCGLTIAALDLTLSATSNFGEHVSAIDDAWWAARKKELPDLTHEPLTARRLRTLSELSARYA